MDLSTLNTLLTAGTLALACAMLSVVVVIRRWAFIGEGISHSGFGGAGTAWLLILLIPSLNQPWIIQLSVVLFCLFTSIAIGALSRTRGQQTENVNSDSAIGVFLVASLAWGFLAQGIYTHERHANPVLFEALLFGRLVAPSPQYALIAVTVSIAVMLILLGLWKEILAYSFDPLLAETSGVRGGFVHYLLMLMIATVIVLGAQLVGSVLMTALLVLPAATALLLSRNLKSVLLLSMLVALSGTWGGVFISKIFRSGALPTGPVIVLIMFVEFLVTYAWSRLARRAQVA